MHMTILSVVGNGHVQPPIAFSFKLISHVKHDVDAESRFMGLYIGIHVSIDDSYHSNMVRRRLFTDYGDGKYTDIFY